MLYEWQGVDTLIQRGLWGVLGRDCSGVWRYEANMRENHRRGDVCRCEVLFATGDDGTQGGR